MQLNLVTSTVRASLKVSVLCLGISCVSACAPSAPSPGPDKQFTGSLEGAVTGAGAGAITGFQLGAGTGPGAAVGAGLGAVAGGVAGALHDAAEEQQMQLARELSRERDIAAVHEILNEHFERRVELHPTRDIFPADLFFEGDSVHLSKEGIDLIRELVKINRGRMPWSRYEIASYVRSSDPEALFGRHLAERRVQEITNYLVRNGIEPRRIVGKGVLTQAPILIDPNDRSDRYNQAIEITPLDR